MRAIPSPSAPSPLSRVLLALVAAGCQQPFAEDRHDLASFRIAAVRADPGVEEGDLTLSAFVYSGHGLYHDTLPTLTWTVGDTTVTDARPTVQVTWPVSITLTASDDAGHTEQAVLDLAAAPTPPLFAGLTRGATDLTLDDIGAPITDRAAHLSGEDVAIAAGGALRLALDMIDDGDRTTHWMGTGGQYAEIDAMTTDWFAGTATLDDGEVEESAPLTDGVWPLVALTFDGVGGNTWTYVDAVVGIAGPFLHVDGRVFPVASAEAGEGWWAATLTAADNLTGIMLEDVTPALDPATDPDAPPPLCGQVPGVVFDVALLAEGLCTRGDVVGARVVVYGTVVP